MNLQYNFLGASGLRVSTICLGTMTFGQGTKNGCRQCTEEEAFGILDRFAEAGGNFIDTANVYQNGLSETILGKWLSRQKREKFVIATKVRKAKGWEDNANGIGLSRVTILKAVEDTLQRLQTDYIDLYQIHLWDSGVPIEETVRTLNNLVETGKVRYLGASNLTGWQMQKIVDLCKYHRWTPWVSLQQQYSLLCRETEFEVVDVCRNEGLCMLPWSPLKGGWLSGKVKRDPALSDLPTDCRIKWTSANGRRNQSHPDYQQFDNEKTWKLLDLMESIGKQTRMSVAQVALKWLLQKDTVASVVIGVTTLEQLEDNLGAGYNWELTPEQMSQLDEASSVEAPYPYEMSTRLNKSRVRASNLK